MHGHNGAIPELPEIFSLLAQVFSANKFLQFLFVWEPVVYALIAGLAICLFASLATRRMTVIPGRLQNTAEVIFGGIDEFICGILGPQGRKYTPFLGTLFIYILAMNLMGLIPFMKPPTSNWSTTLALALCVFFYVQYVAIKELGFVGYLDHLAGKPRGMLAATVILPIFMFTLHIIAELIRPLSLSLRLRSNMFGDDTLLAVMTSFGLTGFPLLFVNMISVFLTAFIQAGVFCLLSTIYFALVLTHEEEPGQEGGKHGL